MSDKNNNFYVPFFKNCCINYLYFKIYDRQKHNNVYNPNFQKKVRKEKIGYE